MTLIKLVKSVSMPASRTDDWSLQFWKPHPDSAEEACCRTSSSSGCRAWTLFGVTRTVCIYSVSPLGSVVRNRDRHHHLWFLFGSRKTRKRTIGRLVYLYSLFDDVLLRPLCVGKYRFGISWLLVELKRIIIRGCHPRDIQSLWHGSGPLA